MDAPLRTRHQDILNAIVRAYIETGEPVGSRTISKRRSQDLSPASIRNVMADLADEGYLAAAAHFGRPCAHGEGIPLLRAQSLSAMRVAAAETERLRQEFSGLHTVGAHMERSSHILMELTRNVGIAAAIPALAQELDQIELVPLADRRVLMVLVTRDHMVRNRVVTLDEPVPPDELASIRNYVNRNFSGWQLGDARRELAPPHGRGARV